MRDKGALTTGPVPSSCAQGNSVGPYILEDPVGTQSWKQEHFCSVPNVASTEGLGNVTLDPGSVLRHKLSFTWSKAVLGS